MNLIDGLQLMSTIDLDLDVRFGPHSAAFTP